MERRPVGSSVEEASIGGESLLGEEARRPVNPTSWSSLGVQEGKEPMGMHGRGENVQERMI